MFVGLFVESAAGGGSVQLADLHAGCPLAWSPDGTAIAYPRAQPDATTELTIIPSSGGPGATIASSPGSEFPESWK